jgi:hypothetical protein
MKSLKIFKYNLFKNIFYVFSNIFVLNIFLLTYIFPGIKIGLPFFVVIISFDNLYYIYVLSSIFVFISFIIEKNIKLYFQLISIIINLITIGIIFYLSNKQLENKINYIQVIYNPQTYLLILLFFFNTYKILNKIKSTRVSKLI